MSIYPIPAVGPQGLYDASNTRYHKLGTIAQFETDDGLVTAMYCRNAYTTSLSAGLPVGIDAGGIGYVHTARLANASFIQNLCLGGLAASMANSASGGYAWVILAGPQTNAFIANAITALSAAERPLGVNSSAQLITPAASNNPVAYLGITTATMASGTGHGNVVHWLWRG